MRTTTQLTIAEAFGMLIPDGLPMRFTAYDGSAIGPEDAPFGLHLATERGLSYLMSSPDPDLALGRAYVAGDLELSGVHPGDPYDALVVLKEGIKFRRPKPSELLAILRSLGISHLKHPAPPPQEAPSRLRRVMDGFRHTLVRDATAIHHHYDVSNRFYEMVLGPSMTYTCALFPHEGATLEEAQDAKYDLVARKLGLQPGQRLLDLGCGWGGMVRHAAREYGVHAIGVTLSREQAEWGQAEIKRQGLDHLAEVRHLDYRHVEETGFDAISSIGLTEHIGVKNYPLYFRFIHDKLKPHGRLLNHCITRPDSHMSTRAGEFIDRYVFPDGELAAPGKIVSAVHDVGFEVQHTENIRMHYARTLAGWCRNLADNWDECVAEVGPNTARVWGLYMAGSRLAFERNEIQLQHVLASKVDESGDSGYPLRHQF